MTAEQDQILSDFFTRYGNPSNEKEIRITGYLQKADVIDDIDRIVRADETAGRIIQELQETIQNLSVYRVSLAERYNYLATAPKVPVVRLKRQRNYGSNKVFYFLCTYEKNILDGHEVQTSSTKYAGAERNKAIKDFNSYVKSHPGIIAEMKIDKPKWER